MSRQSSPKGSGKKSPDFGGISPIPGTGSPRSHKSTPDLSAIFGSESGSRGSRSRTPTPDLSSLFGQQSPHPSFGSESPIRGPSSSRSRTPTPDLSGLFSTTGSPGRSPRSRTSTPDLSSIFSPKSGDRSVEQINVSTGSFHPSQYSIGSDDDVFEMQPFTAATEWPQFEKQSTPPRYTMSSESTRKGWQSFGSPFQPSTSDPIMSTPAGRSTPSRSQRFSLSTSSGGSAALLNVSTASAQALPTGIDTDDSTFLANQMPYSYRFEALIGTGTFSAVYRGNNLQKNENVAIKVMKQGVVSYYTIDLEQRVIQTLRSNPHENVVKYYDTFEQMALGRSYFICEFSELGDLFEMLQGVNSQGIRVWHPIRELLARHYAKGIANGVEHLHRLGLAHGDLKLQNVIMISKGPKQVIDKYDDLIPKLIDFGNSRFRQQTDPEGQILYKCRLCTISTAAPESCNIGPKNPVYDLIKADVYSLGVCLLSMVLGARPYTPSIPEPARTDPEYNEKAKQYLKLYAKIKADIGFTRSLMKPLSHPLKDVLSRMLEPKPQKRITVSEFLTSDWVKKPKSHELDESKVSSLKTNTEKVEKAKKFKEY